MNRFKVGILLLAVPLLMGFDPFNTSNKNVDQGNAKLGAGKYKEALESYDKAAKELPDEAGVHYNRGVALHRLGQFDKAREALLKATLGRDPALKAKSFYNLGNAMFNLKKYKEAAAAYTRSLQLNAVHQSSKWNLELALRMQKEEEKKKKKNKDKDKNKKKKDKKEQGDKKNKDDPSKQKQGKNKKNKQDKKDQQKNKPEKQKKDQQQADKDKPKPQERKQMDSVLDALDRNDKNLQKRRARMQAGGFRKPVKDW